MKYCTHCGKEVNESAVICMNCGCAVKPSEPIGHVNVDPQQRAEVIENAVAKAECKRRNLDNNRCFANLFRIVA